MPSAFTAPPGPPEFQPPGFASNPLAGMSMFNNVLKCEHCGAEFPASSGLGEGDDCPNCSGGSSSGGSSFRMGRGVIKGVVFLVIAVAGFVGWIVKKATGSA